MTIDLKELVTHDGTDECIACRAQDFVAQALLPAAAAWESATDLPRFSLAIHGAAGLIGTMMQEGIPRRDVEQALSQLLDDLEGQMAEDEAMGGPPQGSA
jgi:hypothetical protein